MKTIKLFFAILFVSSMFIACEPEIANDTLGVDSSSDINANEDDGDEPIPPKVMFNEDDGDEPIPPKAMFNEDDGDQPIDPKAMFNEDDGDQPIDPK